MKTKSLTLFAVIFLATATLTQAATNDLSSALQKGLFEEEANHNLEAAEKAYQSVATQFDKDRKLAATAIFRLGEVYRKQGKTNEASAQYERILREFSDQPELVKLSQKFADRRPGKFNSDQVSAIEQLLVSSQSEYQSKAAILSSLRKLDREQLRESLPIVDSDSYLTELLKKLSDAEQKLAVAKKEFASEHPEVKKAQTIVDVITLQMDQRIDATLTALEIQVTTLKAKVEDLENNLAKARKEQSNQSQTSGIVEQARSVLSAEQQEIARIKTMIKDSPDLINAIRSNFTPLTTAASLGQLQVAEFLSANGAEIDRRNSQNQTPLYLAAQNGHRALVELLIAKGADVNRNDSGQTALHIASAQGFKAVAQVLLDNKADVNAKNNGGATPLHQAAEKGPKAIAELLLENGANLNAKDNEGRTPLLLAVSTKNLEMAKFLIEKKADVNAAGKTGAPPLIGSVLQSRPEVVKLLLKAGASTDVKVPFTTHENVRQKSFTALHIAVDKGEPEIVDALLRGGANPNSTNEFGSTPLHFATTGKDIEIVKALLASQAKVNARNRYHNTPLHWAVGHAKKEIVELLLEAGADVNAKTSDGSNPLHIAIKNGQEEIAILLLKYKVDPNVKNDQNETPLSLAQHGVVPSSTNAAALKEIAELLIKSGADENQERRTQIAVTRDGMPRHPIFHKGSNPWNRYSLLETFGLAYKFSGHHFNGVPQFPSSAFRFPNLAKVKIHRLEGNEEREISVDLEAILKTGDCSKDIWLEWGDVIEIPESDHKIDAKWVGFPKPFLENLAKCLTRTVSISVKGEKKDITVAPTLHDTGAVQVPPGAEAQYLSYIKNLGFWLNDIIRGSGLLRNSSDQSRVIVKRKNSTTKQSEEMIFNLGKNDPQAILWLRDGDAIDIPERDPNAPPAALDNPQGVRTIPTGTLQLSPNPNSPVPPN